MATETERTRPSRLIQTAMEAIAGYNAWEIEKIIFPRALNCIHQILPLSLERPPRTNDEYREYFAMIKPHFKDFKLEVWDITEDSARSRVAMRAKNTAMTEIGEFRNEYIFLFQMTPEHDKIVRFDEFVDSKNSTAFFEKLFGQIAARQKNEEGVS